MEQFVTVRIFATNPLQLLSDVQTIAGVVKIAIWIAKIAFEKGFIEPLIQNVQPQITTVVAADAQSIFSRNPILSSSVNSMRHHVKNIEH